MTWTKTPDDYPDQLLDLSDAAYRLHHATTTYCNRVGLDGRLPKARLTLVPVPPKTRRLAVVAELVRAHRWAEDGDCWTLRDFFAAQPSAEETAFQREYDRIRQALRFAKDAETKAALRLEEERVKRDLFAARERRRARSQQDSHRDSTGASHRDSHRPALSRPRPPRNNEGEGEVEGRPATEDGTGPRPLSVGEPAIGILKARHQHWLHEDAPDPACPLCAQRGITTVMGGVA